MRNKIAMLIPYFGKWPQWMNFYLYTCSQNPIIDILFFSDIPFEPEWNIPGNVKYFHTTFPDYCKRISETLNYSFTPSNPYKLCDIKPFYGYIHQKELTGYDFWGFGDIDLIYGDLSNFLNDTILDGNDYISCHADRVSGPFFLARNTPDIIQKAFKIKKWKELLNKEKYSGVDERWYFEILSPLFNKIHKLRRLLLKIPFKSHRKTLKFYNNIIHFMQGIYRFKHKKMHFREMYSNPVNPRGFSFSYLYSNGKITDIDVNKEIMYLHFLSYKKHLWPENNANLTINTNELPNKNVLIDTSGFNLQDRNA